MGCRSQWGTSGDPGGLENARRFANWRTRASHCISDDVGKTGMSGDTPPLKGGQVSLALLSRGTRSLAISLWTKITVLSVHLPRSGCKISDFRNTLSEIPHFFVKQTKRGNTAGRGLHCGPGWSSGQRLGRNGYGWPNWERTRENGEALVVGFLEEACWLATPGQNTEHEELIDANSTRVGWRSSRPNRLYSGPHKTGFSETHGWTSTSTAKRTTDRS